MLIFKKFVYFIKRPFHFVKTGLLVGLPAEIQNKFPARKLKIICITGTDGKTTSSTLLYKVLSAAGKKVALLSTVAAYIGTEEIDTGFHVTTPDPKLLQKFMRRLVNEGYEYLVLESTSHGIYQYRLWGVHPFITGVTNITMEHLDYHLTHDLYVEAKAELLKKAQVAVVNADDEMSFNKLKKILHKSNVQMRTYGLDMELSPKVVRAIKSKFPEHYNLSNARLVYTIAKELEVEDEAFIKGLKNFASVPGRMQEVDPDASVQVIVDFAHTPNALDEALTAIRSKMKTQKRKGKLIAVFGCAGLRDHLKRPAMGRIGAELADLAIFTAEDPRTENVWAIIRQMKSNLGTSHGKVVSIANRGDAVLAAIQKYAEPGDTVGIFGKGHEKSMCYGSVEQPWSDLAAAQEALARRKD
jgi:UDP-N-acetylmuramoyl-L-alanyl-D-glutamate--2,6-diaminopimelate ligase